MSAVGVRLEPGDRVRYVKTLRGWFWLVDDRHAHDGPFGTQAEAIAGALSRTLPSTPSRGTVLDMANDDSEKAKETIKPPKQGPIDQGDSEEPAHHEAEKLKPIGD